MSKISGIVIIIVIIVIILIILLISASAPTQAVRYINLKNPNLEKLENNFQQLPKSTSARVVVSLTTIPDRIEFMKPTIASILDQSVKVDEIAINIPLVSRKGLTYEIPTWMQNMKSITIHRIQNDHGPATKLLPTLERENPDTRIIVVDDDVVYNSDTVKILLDTFDKNNQTAAITNFGILLQKNSELPTNSSRVGSFFTKSREVDLVQGFSGFLVTPRMFYITNNNTTSSDEKFYRPRNFDVSKAPNNIFELEKGPKEAISVDDIWVSGWLRHNKIKIMSTDSTFLRLPLVNIGKMRQTTALGKGENKNFTRDLIVIKWFRQNMGVMPVVLNQK